MGRPRALQHFASFPGCRKADYIDEALSAGFQNTRDSLPEILPFLKEEEYKADINGLAKKVESLEQQLACYKAEAKDPEKKLAEAEAEANDVKKKLAEAEAEANDVTKKLATAEAEGNYWKKKCDDRNAVFDRKAKLRVVLSNFKKRYRHANVKMMQEVHRKFPNAFPPWFTIFTAMVSDLVRQQMSQENQKDHSLLLNIEQRLLNLLTVATDDKFMPGILHWWTAKKGEQLFHLCRSVAQWNKDTFHPDLKRNILRPLMMNEISKGLFKVDDKGFFSDTGLDLGPISQELLFD